MSTSTPTPTTYTSTSTETHLHLHHLRLALTLATYCPPTTTAFSVGAVLVSRDGAVLSTGFSRELPGNTHAEQCALQKLLPALPPPGTTLYTTMEPCATRLSGNVTCLQRVLDTPGIGAVVVGVREPATFVAGNECERVLRENGRRYVYVPGLEAEILAVAARGHGGGGGLTV